MPAEDGENAMKDVFNQLNYSLGNEDNYLEQRLILPGVRHAMSIAGSGVTPMALLSKGPRILSCVDIALEQLSMTELRIETARCLGYDEFLSFWSYPGFDMSRAERRSIFNRITLTAHSRKFFENLFNKYKWRSILYSGRFEKLLPKSNFLGRLLLGRKCTDIFNSSNIEEQCEYFLEKFPRKRFDAVIFLHAFCYEKMLKFMDNLLIKNIDKSFHDFFKQVFYNLMQKTYLRENLFAQLYFCTRLLYLEACPPECDPSIFAHIKKNSNTCEIRYVHENIIKAATDSNVQINFISFSNVPSYFSEEYERKYLQLIKQNLSRDAMVVNRYHLRIPENVDLTDYLNITQDYINIIKSESTQLYQVEVFQRL